MPAWQRGTQPPARPRPPGTLHQPPSADLLPAANALFRHASPLRAEMLSAHGAPLVAYWSIAPVLRRGRGVLESPDGPFLHRGTEALGRVAPAKLPHSGPRNGTE